MIPNPIVPVNAMNISIAVFLLRFINRIIYRITEMSNSVTG